MVLDCNLCNCAFGKVMYMFSSKSKVHYFVLNQLIISFGSHYFAYEIIKNENCSGLKGFYINGLPDPILTVARDLGNEKMYATLTFFGTNNLIKTMIYLHSNQNVNKKL